MEQSKKVIGEFEKTIDEFVQILSLFTQEQVNQVPFKDSWTGAQVGRHIIKMLDGLPQMLLHGETKKTERAPDEKVKEIDAVFLDFSVKFKSPDFLVPEDKIYKRGELINELTKLEKTSIEAAEGLDLTPTILSFELPGTGHLTRYELIHFSTVHTQRHIRQLKNIYKEVTGKVSAV